MSFDIKFQRTSSMNNKVGKSIDDVVTFSGTLKNETSVLDPVILVELPEPEDPEDPDTGEITERQFFQCNYAYIQRFARHYFITDMRSIRNNIVEVSMHVDVLETYKDDIKDLNAIIRRQENIWNLYLDDGVLQTYQNPHIIPKEFPSGFTAGTAETVILAVAGS